jgi:putative DNA primase/helicase
MTDVHTSPAIGNTTSATTIIDGLEGNHSTGMCRCPAHNDRIPSLHVSTGRNGSPVFHCHAGCSQEAVIAALKQRGLWGGRNADVIPLPQRRQQEEREREEYEKRTSCVPAVFNRAVSGTEPLRRYFQGRGIDTVPPSAAYLEPGAAVDLARKRPDLGLGHGEGQGAPIMAFPIWSGRKVTGVHATMLSRDGRTKLNDNARRTLGIIKGGYIQLGYIDRARPLDRLIIAEGVETAMAAAQICGGIPMSLTPPLIPGSKVAAIAALSAGNMPNVEPPAALDYIIAADNDETGMKKAKELAEKLAGPGRTVRIAAPPSGDWNDALRAAGRNTQQLAWYREKILQADPIYTGLFLPTARAMTMGEILELDFPPLAYLLKPWLSTGALAMIHAKRGDGKTRFAMQIGYAVATGTPLLSWSTGEPRRVLYVDGELPGGSLLARLRVLGPKSDNLMILARDVLRLRNCTLPSLATPEGQQWLNAIIESCGAEFIILDSLSTLFGTLVENEPEAWGPIQEWMMAHRFRGRSILLVHHEGKATGSQRGHSKREDAMDVIVRLQEQRDQATDAESAFELSFPKCRDFHGADAKPMLLRLNTTSGAAVWTHEAIEDSHTRVAALRAEGYTQAEIARRLNLSPSRVSRVVHDIERGGRGDGREGNGHDRGGLWGPEVSA